MFERYTERAKRVIFFGRYEASHLGSTTIESHHMLLGLIREDKNLTNRFLRNSASIQDIRREVLSRTEVREKVSTSIDLPLSQECGRILAFANEESLRLNHHHIGTEHLLLGILREESCLAAQILFERGLRLVIIREELVRAIPDRAAPTPTLDEIKERLVAIQEKLAGSVADKAGETVPRAQVGGHTLAINSDMLAEMLDKYDFAASKEHLQRALVARSAGVSQIAQTELRRFLDSLVDTIQERNPNSETLSPIFEGFNWRASVQGVRSGLPEDEDWKFRFWLTLLLAELLLERYVRNRQ